MLMQQTPIAKTGRLSMAATPEGIGVSLEIFMKKDGLQVNLFESKKTT